MEEEKRSNTILLTVIAIATLLVAVIGATFAYFSANSGDISGKITVEATTATAADTFTATGSAALSLNITADKMQKTDYDVVADSDTVPELGESGRDSITISLMAGYGSASCTYDLYYHPDNVYGGPFTPSAEAVNAQKKEYTISGDSSINANDFNEIDVSGTGTNNKILLKSGAIISDSVDLSESQNPTTDTWRFTAKFYNLSVNQSSVLGQSFGGYINVENVNCTNSATP